MIPLTKVKAVFPNRQAHTRLTRFRTPFPDYGSSWHISRFKTVLSMTYGQRSYTSQSTGYNDNKALDSMTKWRLESPKDTSGTPSHLLSGRILIKTGTRGGRSGRNLCVGFYLFFVIKCCDSIHTQQMVKRILLKDWVVQIKGREHGEKEHRLGRELPETWVQNPSACMKPGTIAITPAFLWNTQREES